MDLLAELGEARSHPWPQIARAIWHAWEESRAELDDSPLLRRGPALGDSALAARSGERAQGSARASPGGRTARSPGRPSSGWVCSSLRPPVFHLWDNASCGRPCPSSTGPRPGRRWRRATPRPWPACGEGLPNGSWKGCESAGRRETGTDSACSAPWLPTIRRLLGSGSGSSNRPEPCPTRWSPSWSCGSTGEWDVAFPVGGEHTGSWWSSSRPWNVRGARSDPRVSAASASHARFRAATPGVHGRSPRLVPCARVAERA